MTNGFIPGAGPQSLGGTTPQRGRGASAIGPRGVQIRRQSSFPNPSALQARRAQAATSAIAGAATLGQSPMLQSGLNPAMTGMQQNPMMNPAGMAAMQYAAMQQASMMEGMAGDTMAMATMQQGGMTPDGLNQQRPNRSALTDQLRNHVKDTLKSSGQLFIQNLADKGSIKDAFNATVDDTKKKIKNDVSGAMAGAAGIQDEDDKADLQEKLGSMFNTLFKNKNKAETAAKVFKTGAAAKTAASAAAAAGAGPIGVAGAAAVVVGSAIMKNKKPS